MTAHRGDMAATQHAATVFESAYPGGLRVYAAQAKLYDVDIEAAEKVAHIERANPWLSMGEIAAALNEESSAELWTTSQVAYLLKRRGLGRRLPRRVDGSGGKFVASRGELRAAFGDGTPRRLRGEKGKEMTKKKVASKAAVKKTAKPVKKRKPSAKAIDAAISAASQGCHVDVKTIAKGLGLVATAAPLPLDERIRALLTDHPLDAVLCGLARVHSFGAKNEWDAGAGIWKSAQNADAEELRKCVGKLSFEAGKVLKSA